VSKIPITGIFLDLLNSQIGDHRFAGFTTIKQSGILKIFLNDLKKIKAFQNKSNFLNCENQSLFKSIIARIETISFKNKYK